MATLDHPALQPVPPEPDGLPPLQHGDRLTRPEFERRYDAMPYLKKAELLEGIVYMPSPVSQERHSRQHFQLVTWLGVYSAATPGTEGGDNATLRLPGVNEPQPDALLMIRPGGQARIDEEGYLEGAPELAAEVAASSASYDLHAKLEVYRKHGVREYLVWRVLDRAVDWFVLRDGAYQPLPPDEDGVYRSEVFPGLWLAPDALVGGDLAEVLRVLQEGTSSPEHAAFVERLRGKGDS